MKSSRPKTAVIAHHCRNVLWAALGMAAAVALTLPGRSHAADPYPAKPITMVVLFAAGGPTDGGALGGGGDVEVLGQTVVVENRLGAGGTVSAAYVAKAAPDGYTILIHHNGMATAPALYSKLSYKPLTDFSFVGQVADVPMTLLGRHGPAGQHAAGADYLYQAEPEQGEPGERRAGRRVAAMRHAVPEGHRRGIADDSVPGHRAGADRAAGRSGGCALRPDHADAAAYQGGEGEAVRRDHGRSGFPRCRIPPRCARAG